MRSHKVGKFSSEVCVAQVVKRGALPLTLSVQIPLRVSKKDFSYFSPSGFERQPLQRLQTI